MFGETIKDLCINFNVPEGHVSYSGGERLEGQISFQLTRSCALNSVTLTLRGWARVAWTTGSRKHRRSHSAQVVYFKSKTVILVNEQAAISSKLPPGTHVYPFTCHIPQGDFPSSFKGRHGEIVYMLIVGLDRPWHFTKEYSTKINFASRSYPDYELMTPLLRSNNMTLCCLCCASGPISMNVRLERKAFRPGEAVRILCEFSNGSSRVAKSKAVLVQKQVFSTLSGTKRIIALPLASRTGDPVGPHSGDVHCELTLDLPGDLLFSIGNCQILELSYAIEVHLSVKYARDLTVPCPIFICNPPQYNGAPVGVC